MNPSLVSEVSSRQLTCDSPATDLAHLVLTSSQEDLTEHDWEQVVEEYYKHFNVSLNRFGLVLKHLGTNFNQFRAEVRINYFNM